MSMRYRMLHYIFDFVDCGDTNMNSKKEQSSTLMEWIVRIGVVVLLVGVLVSFFIYNIRCATPISNDTSKDFGHVLWKSLVSGDSGLVLIMTIVVDILTCAFVRQIKKSKVIGITATIYIITVFDTISIEYQLAPSWVAIGNFMALVICSIIVLTTRAAIPCMGVSKYGVFRSDALAKAVSDTRNKKIIATQLYEVKTSLVSSTDAQHAAKVKFDIAHIGDDFVRSGYDVNSMSCASYIMDRDIVDCFPLILELYEKFRESGDDNEKKVLLTIINEKVQKLEKKLSEIKTEINVTKEDCCVARALSILLSFRHKLDMDCTHETQDDYLGEISLHDGDLKLSADIENRLFSLYRTGILGVALLDTKSRHVFQYRKLGSKRGRTYCVSQLVSLINSETGGFSNQTMYICLFTIEQKESEFAFIHGYMFNSISEREKAITSVLNTIKQGGNDNG